MTMIRATSLSAPGSPCGARKRTSMVRTVASSSNGAWRYVTCSSSMLIADDDGDAPAQEFTVAPLDEQSELTCTSSDGYSESGPPAVPPPISPIPEPITTIAPSTRNIDNYYRNCQDVLSVVNNPASTTNSSTASCLTASSLERHLSSRPSHQHGSLNPPSSRPRTFTSTSDLANHYGIPTILPPAPSTTPRRSSLSDQPPTEYPDFIALSANYLNMLNSKSQDNTSAIEPPSSAMATINPAELSSPAALPLQLQQLIEQLSGAVPPTPGTSPAMLPQSPDSPEFLTSGSPYTPFTPDDDFLTTPLFDDSVLFTSPLIHDGGDFEDMGGMDLFGGVEEPEIRPTVDDNDKVESTVPVPPQPDTSSWLTMSPSSPSLDAYPSPAVESLKPPSSRRKTSATGTRKNITPEALVPFDAPTQPRKYLIPSATSRKDLPVTFARKRARSQAFNDDDELEAEAPGPNATEKEQIEWKRRQNTLAARKSRKRKLEHQQWLEDQVRTLTSDRDKWKTRALTLQNMLLSHGIPFTQFDD